jgi:hypothetical protein
MIDNYQFGNMTIDGQLYQKDVIITSGRVICPWWREEGHLLQPKDLAEHLLKPYPENLVIGTGKFGVMKLADEFQAWCAEQGMTLIYAKTEEAVRLFNQNMEKGSSVAGAFHLTC